MIFVSKTRQEHPEKLLLNIDGNRHVRKIAITRDKLIERRSYP